MGWSFPWASSLDSDFNFDFNVSFTEEQVFGPAMKTGRKASIINIASVSAHLPLSSVVAYSDNAGQSLS